LLTPDGVSTAKDGAGKPSPAAVAAVVFRRSRRVRPVRDDKSSLARRWLGIGGSFAMQAVIIAGRSGFHNPTVCPLRANKGEARAFVLS